MLHIDDSCSLIVPNVFQVKVMFESSRLTVLEDKPALTMESLLGTMGGTLNLWIGISFVTIIELIDMLLTLILGGISRPKVEDSPGNEKQDSQGMPDVGWMRKWRNRKPEQLYTKSTSVIRHCHYEPAITDSKTTRPTSRRQPYEKQMYNRWLVDFSPMVLPSEMH